MKRFFFLCLWVFTRTTLAQEIPIEPRWYEAESTNFRVVYRQRHAHLVPHILRSAERALARLSELFSYTPSETIVINTYDVNDYGAGSATTVPRNYIWLDIAPLEPGYENIPYNERIQWLLSHELVHVVVNDMATNVEAFSRSVFSKVAPEQVQPLSIFYSVLTNYSRYTPRWHQEGIAVFLETWLSGGFGRSLGNFDEMYFRSLVLEGKQFPSDILLETQVAHRSFLVETVFYLFGQRFATHLALKHGPEKLVEWYKTSLTDVYVTFKEKFKRVFGVEFETAWDEFIVAERNFQTENISRLKSFPLTPIVRLSDSPVGAVTHPHADASGTTVYWGQHRPHHLAEIRRCNIADRISAPVVTLPTPSMHQVASTAFDPGNGVLFYTTKNNQLYRDLWCVNVETGGRKIIFEHARVGHLTVSPATHELWGVRHDAGVVSLVYSAFPYDSLRECVFFDVGDEVHGLAVSPSGEWLAAVVHRSNGDQSIVLAPTDVIRQGKQATYRVITSLGSPENPSWSRDGSALYWNAYTNGVSNIYKTRVDTINVVPVTHTLVGLFKPVELNPDTLFAFEFTTDGFVPVLIPNATAEKVPALRYLGQETFDRNPQLRSWVLDPKPRFDSISVSEPREYNGLRHLKVVAFMPVITGFQSKKVLGAFLHVSDLILNHDMFLEAGISPFGEKNQPTEFHLKLKYDIRKEFEIGWEYNGPDFYDLFNARKRGMLGSKIRLGHTHYWIYDNPQKMKQQSEIALYRGVQLINENLVRVSQPDFLVAQTSLNSQSLRRTIGSSDYESGDEYTITTMFFGSNQKFLQTGYQIYGEWGRFVPYLFPHNVFHLKIAAGYHNAHSNVTQSRFFFGGFGNRGLENVDAKQYRKVFRFPGIRIYSWPVDRFAKIMVENNFPPLRFGDVSLGQHFMNHLDASAYANILVANTSRWYGMSIGAQGNIVLKHWSNLESTLSFGVARAWVRGNAANDWFISFKLLRNY